MFPSAHAGGKAESHTRACRMAAAAGEGAGRVHRLGGGAASTRIANDSVLPFCATVKREMSWAVWRRNESGKGWGRERVAGRSELYADKLAATLGGTVPLVTQPLTKCGSQSG
eukprot:758726-Hanusia_phi.AAC.5